MTVRKPTEMRLSVPSFPPLELTNERKRSNVHGGARRRDESETETESVDEELRCPECSGQLASDTEHGETVCVDCGLVVEEDEIDRGPEWRAFDSSEKEEESALGPQRRT